MPVRIPKARASENITLGVAGVVGFAPLYFLIPSAEERLASQTLKWAPRWERNMSHVVAPARSVAQRIERPVRKTVKRIDDRLPLETMAKNVDKNIKIGMDRIHMVKK